MAQHTRRAHLLLIAFALYPLVAEQTPRFEVASIRPSAPGGTPTGAPRGVLLNPSCSPLFGAQLSPVQLTLINCTLRDLVSRAWSLRKFEFPPTADPAWISSLRYDITAKSTISVRPSDQQRMIQPLLEDRFRLKWHREKREVSVYYLTLGKGGLKLPATKPGSCTPWDHKGPPPPPDPDKRPTCDYTLMPATPDRLGLGMDGTGVSMASFAELLTGAFGEPVIDRTGITTIFDLHIKFSRDSVPGYANRPGEPTDAGSDPSGLPSIFTAIRSLGLNIEAGKGPIEVFVIDGAQKPSEN